MGTVTVTVLAGGTSDERDVSRRSGAAVATALREAGYRVDLIDPASLTSDELETACSTSDIIFPILHGRGGEDGALQTWLESRNFCYVGADAEVSALCFDKIRFKAIVSGFGIITPPSELVDATTIWQSPLIVKPYVLKPHDGGSSVDTFIIRNTGQADRAALEAAFGRHPQMLLETLIEGQEITVGVIDSIALPVVEIIPPADGEFDYENKYNGKTSELCPPQQVSDGLQQQAAALALNIHRKLHINDLSRTDMIIRSYDKAIFVLETNTLPGMTNQSLLPKAAATAGYNMAQLCKLLVDTALARYSTR